MSHRLRFDEDAPHLWEACDDVVFDLRDCAGYVSTFECCFYREQQVVGPEVERQRARAVRHAFVPVYDILHFREIVGGHAPADEQAFRLVEQRRRRGCQ